jgi:hypothetical protein
MEGYSCPRPSQDHARLSVALIRCEQRTNTKRYLLARNSPLAKGKGQRPGRDIGRRALDVQAMKLVLADALELTPIPFHGLGFELEQEKRGLARSPAHFRRSRLPHSVRPLLGRSQLDKTAVAAARLFVSPPVGRTHPLVPRAADT